MTPPGVTKERLRATAKAIADNEYIPDAPHMRQLEFLSCPQKEKGYGGAAGGGKSKALLMDALLPIKQRGYAGLILRRSYPELALPGSIMDIAKEWLLGRPDVKWNERDKVFTFPKYRSKLQFGHLSREDDKYRYQGPEFQRINFDEATQFPWSQYAYLRSRLRRSQRVSVPPSLGAASNPGGIGHNWFYRWFVKGDGKERVFIPAKISDNKYLRGDEYRLMLKDLDEITRRQLLDGEWITDESGRPFKKEFWDERNRYLSVAGLDPRQVIGRWFFIDTPFSNKHSSAYYALVVLELMEDYRVRLRYVWREKVTFPTFVKHVVGWANDYSYDSQMRGIIIEDKANGPALYQTIRDGQDPVARSLVRPFMPRGSKHERYSQAALWCERDCVELPYPTENNVTYLFAFEEEIYEAPDGDYLDQADAFSMGVIFLEHMISTGYWARERIRTEILA